MAAGMRFKERVRAGSKMIGAWSLTGSADVVEIMAMAGFDFIVIDHEHGQGSIESAASQLRSLKDTGCAGIVRVPSNDPIYIKRVLDIGVDGLMVPNIGDKAAAERAVAACRYPPAGTRGAFSGMRANRYGLDTSYHQGANDAITVIVQIESRDAVGNIADIARVDGIDAMFIGPRDLSASLGKLNRFDDSEVSGVITQAERAIKRSGMRMGSIALGPDRARAMLASDYDFVVSGSDTSIIAQSSASIVRTALGSH
ncbi:HpcH/HpaI aldolase family protein [Bradyrhizobium sp. 930_D9_N1_4]|uniref:HpcH/HpaI aldolase family protein n=1 Tax=Bradyrhizobium sp. 930_D9_N1_4 TaxID=3240374 RepID=UPI003F89AEE8